MSISIIIPNYNGEAILKKNLPSVLHAALVYEKKGNKSEIIIVDDCSTDSSLDYLQQFAVDSKRVPIKIITSKENKGFSSTVNKGVEQATGDIIILLNTDVSPTENFLFPLLPHFNDQRVFAVGCLDKSIENGKTVERGRGIGKWEKGFLVHARGEVDKSSTLWVSGGSSAFRREYWIHIGGLLTIYNPFYWEDIDISYRAQKAGYSIIFEPQSIVFHEHEKGAILTNRSENEVKKIAYRNQFLFVWVNAGITQLNLHILWLGYHLFCGILRKDWPFCIGFLNAFKLLPIILQLRRSQHYKREISDKAITAQFSGEFKHDYNN